jgi:hypothetical protein
MVADTETSSGLVWEDRKSAFGGTMSSSDDKRFDALLAAVREVLANISGKYESTVKEGGTGFLSDEFLASGVFYELVPSNPEAATIRVHPEYPGDTTIYANESVVYCVERGHRDLEGARQELEDVISGIAQGHLVIQPSQRFLLFPVRNTRIQGSSGRLYRAHTRPAPPMAIHYPAYRRRRAE